MPQTLAPPATAAADQSLVGKTVLQIVPDLQSGGAERATIDMAEALALAGGRCLVASRGGRMVSELQSKGGIWIPFPAATKNPFAMALNSVQLARILRDEGVDIVHARSRAPAWVAYYATRQTGVKFVTTYHSAYYGASPIKLRYNAIMAVGDTVIAISEFAAQRIRKLHPESSERVVIIPRGADLRVFSPDAVSASRVRRLRAQWKVAAHERVVLLPARLAARKGHAVMIEAAKRLAAEGVADIRILFVGDPHSESFRQAIETQIMRAGVADLVRNAGHCDDMPAAYLAAAVVVAPSTEPEAFGRVAIEAQAMGAPVIVSDIGASPEIVQAPPQTPRHQATGWRVPPGDPAALAYAVSEALALTASSRDELMLRARANVQRRFSVEQMQRATLDVYRRLLQP
ncbi:glycosyltransferase family 4 protein [Methylocystis sp. MJC1]|jgi:glycosyltransferase involved in cell wall biosynthesis|uniref:glycosyltransferase family 4 protein n=1 Tax=Methylocystis sp. MJC1 TaxID=2654282 RepID=UPI0013EC2CB3|nr:glycosyltransferase family 4 protein [Methylocystis sp. MJC1]KAF2989684.1 N-acetyl-alpha-D-glucosaminyl L-malate synthase [Methylocystis sp. MJC1]MBU6525608.1 glycosyltransferase family 4 protein [Methylocystis sp. MJC1]UZX13827.1 glycosyltransferase family 4 protein [Methylocystis sp. MJC1]